MDFFSGTIIFIFLGTTLAFVGAFLYWKSRQLEKRIKDQQDEARQKMYELAILKEVGDRIGYSLNVQKIADVITGSLNQFLEYSVASYMLLEPEKIIFKADINRSVSGDFIKDIKDRMRNSLAALLGKDSLGDMRIEEILTGAIALNEVREPVRSFFNIPLVIGDRLVGVLTIAHTKAGLYKENEMTILYKIVSQASNAVTRLEEVVKTEQGRLEAMVKSMADGIIMIDKDYRILVVNPAAERVIGFMEEDEVTLFDFVKNLKDSLDIKEKLEESMKQGTFVTVDEVSINERFFQVLVFPVRGILGSFKNEILGGGVIFHDITKEKEAEKMREDFTSMMVHELRSPLDGIKKMGELMKSDDDIRLKKETYGEYVSMIYEGSSQMLQLVNSLLDVAKLESGKFEVYRRPSDFKSIILERARFFDTVAKGARIELKTVLDKQLPAQIEVDPFRISQVLNNLISNALKYTGHGGTVSVQAFLHKENADVFEEAERAGVHWVSGDQNKVLKDFPDSVVVAVTDTGEGISQEDIPNLFNKFKQFKSELREEGNKEGTGLGLVVAKGVVESHGGKIGVVSKKGIGTTFYFVLSIKK